MTVTERVRVDGNHLTLGGAPYRLKGVTYGSFAPRPDDGAPFPRVGQVAADFAAMAAIGLNVVRTYAVPPADVVDLAGQHGLRLLVGAHYQDWRYYPEPGRRANRAVLDAGRRAVAEAVERCADTPHVVAISVGNEVPADVVRVHGISRVEETLGRLVEDVHAAGPEALATYSNFPTTEYLDIPGLDVVSFNVFLENPEAFRRYLARLHLRAADRPLLLTELGLASGAHGEAAQAASLEWQLRAVDEAGIAGATVFSWTDEWDVAGYSQADWGFGMTTAQRTPKPALAVVQDWAGRAVVDLRPVWPKVSVVVCAYNEGRRIRGCLESLARCTYPNLEVLICDDGSKDDTLAIAREYPFRVLDLPHGGLSRARDAGIDAATGEIIAFLDADAECHAEWPFFIALSMERNRDVVGGGGGPNLPFADAPLVEHAVSASPGNPLAVLVGDDRAEHVAGCNSAFRAGPIRQIGGFNPAYTSAGDDVDVCWKLLDAGYQIAYSPAAQVTHHRRDSVKGYLRQQRGYGRAEKMLSGSHAHRFNRLGQATWSGFIYGGLRPLRRALRPIVYHGYAGTAPYQGVRSQPAETLLAWLIALLPFAVPVAAVGLVLAFWSLWFLAVPAAALGMVLATAVLAGGAARPPKGVDDVARFRLLVGYFHVAQPLVRAWGRLRGEPVYVEPVPPPGWTGDRLAWLVALTRALKSRGCFVTFGGDVDPFDLDVVAGVLVRARIVTAVTWNWVPHVRVTYRPRWGSWVVAALAALALVAGGLPWAAGAVVVAVGLVAAGEAMALRRRVRAAIGQTVPAAGPDAAARVEPAGAPVGGRAA